MCARPRAAETPDMITIENLTRRYGAHTAVDDVTFTARPGRVTGFLGPNGAGKSTSHAHPGRADPALLGLGHRPGPALRRPAQPRARGRRAARRLGPARRSHRPRDPDPGPAHHGARPAPGSHEMLERVEPDRRGGRAPGAALLPRHAPAARHRDRPDRRPAGAGPRRAGQRARPRRHPLDARPAARLRRRAAAPCCSPRHLLHEIEVVADDLVVIGAAGSSPAAPRPSCSPAPAPTSASATASRWRPPSPQPGTPPTPPATTHWPPTPTPPSSAGSPCTPACALHELRAADGAGLEEMFLQLTADTQRETTPTRAGASSMSTPTLTAASPRGGPADVRRPPGAGADPVPPPAGRGAAQDVRHPLGRLADGQHRADRAGGHRGRRRLRAARRC